jgi:hypothetical protein
MVKAQQPDVTHGYGIDPSDPAGRPDAHKEMPDHPVDLIADTADIIQVEPDPLQSIPVHVQGPVETRELPSKRIAFRTVPVPVAVVGVTPSQKLVAADPRRIRVTLIPRTADIYVGTSQATAVSGGAWFPSVVPMQFATNQELWASGTAATDVTVIEEFWAQ